MVGKGEADLRVSEVELPKKPEVSSREAFGIETLGEFFRERLSVVGSIFSRVLVFYDVEADEPVPSRKEDIDRLRSGVFEFAVQLCNLGGKSVERHQAAKVLVGLRILAIFSQYCFACSRPNSAFLVDFLASTTARGLPFFPRRT